MTFSGVNYLAIFVAALAGWIIGAAYYMSLSKAWIDAHGQSEAEFKARGAAHWKSAPWLPFVLVFVAEIVMAWVLAGLLAHLGPGQTTIRNGIVSALFVWGGFVVTTTGSNYMFGMQKTKLIIIDSGHWLLVLLAAGIVLGAFGS